MTSDGTNDISTQQFSESTWSTPTKFEKKVSLWHSKIPGTKINYHLI